MVRIDYYLKGCMVEQKCKNNITGRTNLFYAPKYFRKGQRERKGEQKGGGKDNLTRQGQLFYG